MSSTPTPPTPPHDHTPDMTAAAPLLRRLADLKTLDYQGVSGKFHSHITTRLEAPEDPKRLQELQDFCRAHRVKLTLIDLSRFDGPAQRDVMTTQHHRDPSPDAVHHIIDALTALCRALIAAGFPILRVKLEHESLPTLPAFSPSQYREVHVKLAIPPDDYPDTMRRLALDAPRFGFVPSRNPLDRKPDAVTQFLNMRLYQGTLADADAHTHALVEHLRSLSIPIREVKQETAIFDTHRDHDRWWT
jgi:hypothetical protein